VAQALGFLEGDAGEALMATGIKSAPLNFERFVAGQRSQNT
jgi:hypothetical protein